MVPTPDFAAAAVLLAAAADVVAASVAASVALATTVVVDADEAASDDVLAVVSVVDVDVDVDVEEPVVATIAASLPEETDVVVEVDDAATASWVEASVELSVEPPPPHPATRVLTARATPELQLARNIVNRIEKSRKEGKSGVSTFSARLDESRRMSSVFGGDDGGVEFEKPANLASIRMAALLVATAVSAHDRSDCDGAASLDRSAWAPAVIGSVEPRMRAIRKLRMLIS